MPELARSLKFFSDKSIRISVGFFLLFEDFKSHVIDSGIIKYNNTSVGTRFNVDTGVFTKLIVCATEVIAYGLNCYVEFVCYLMDGSFGEACLEFSQFVERDWLAHRVSGFNVLHPVLFTFA